MYQFLIIAYLFTLMGGLFFSVSTVSFQAFFFIVLYLLIITLFQEDNIFGMNASLTYVLRYKDIHAFDNNKTMKNIYSMYRAGEVFVHRSCIANFARIIYPGQTGARITSADNVSLLRYNSLVIEQ